MRRLIAVFVCFGFCVGLALVAACPSRDEGSEPTRMNVQWWFANGADCVANHVTQVLVRANKTGADAIPMQVPCEDGSLVFPPEGQQMQAGRWNVLAQALDASGQSCFLDAGEMIEITDGDQANLRVIFHKKTSSMSAVCQDIGEDVDGGVPEPDGGGEGEGEGEGELGFDAEVIEGTSPTWQPTGFTMFSLPLGEDTPQAVAAALNTVIMPNHQMHDDGSIEFGEPHEPPYDNELADLFEQSGLPTATELTVDEFSPPNMMVFEMVLVPTDGAPTGSTPDGDLPMIGNDQYPINIDGNLVNGDGVFDPEFDGQLVGMDALEAPYDGFSHNPMMAYSNAGRGPGDADLPGRYELQLRMTDASGAGWNVTFAFAVQ